MSRGNHITGGTINVNPNSTLYIDRRIVNSTITLTGTGDTADKEALRMENNGNGQSFVSGPVIVNGLATFGSDGGGWQAISGNISGGTLLRTNNSASSFLLSGSNSFAALTITAGPVILGSSNALGVRQNPLVAFSGASSKEVLDLNGYNATVGGLEPPPATGTTIVRNQSPTAYIGGFTNNSPATLTVANTVADTYAGTLSNGTAALVRRSR